MRFNNSLFKEPLLKIHIKLFSYSISLYHFPLCTCHRLPPEVGPWANQGNMSGNTKDGLDSQPLGRGKFARFFQIRRKGVGEYEIL